MAQASEVVTSQLNPSKEVPLSQGSGNIDANLILSTAAVTADGNTTAIPVEGGAFLKAQMNFGAVTGTTPTLTTKVQVSVDNGSTYQDICIFPALTEANIENVEIARAFYLPRANSSNKLVLVRINDDVGGTTPSFARTAFLQTLGFGRDTALEKLV